jgi:hypothetical protein
VFELAKAGKVEEARKAQLAVSLAGRIELGGGIPGMRVSWLVVALGLALASFRKVQSGS